MKILFLAFSCLVLIGFKPCQAQTETSSTSASIPRKGDGGLRISVFSPVFASIFEGNMGGKYWLEENTAITAVVSIYGGVSGNGTISKTNYPLNFARVQSDNLKGRTNILVGGSLEHHFLSNRHISPYVGGLAAIGLGWSGNGEKNNDFSSSIDTALSPNIPYQTIQKQNADRAGYIGLVVGGVVGVEYFPVSWLSLSVEAVGSVSLSGNLSGADFDSTATTGINRPRMVQVQSPSTFESRKSDIGFSFDLRPSLTAIIYVGREGIAEILRQMKGNQ